MTAVAGVDIGNSTTEIVVSSDGEPVAWDRRPTRGHKGSPESVRAAAALLRTIERNSRVHTDRVVVAPWRPVMTRTTTLERPPPDTGRIRLLHCAHESVVGNDVACGRPWTLSADPPQVPVIALVAAGTGYARAAQRINDAIEQGAEIRAAVVADDEAVLIAARISIDIPVVDGADTTAALQAQRLFVEVRPAGQCVRTATDVWALHDLLQTREEEMDALGQIARWTRDERAVVLALDAVATTRQDHAGEATVTWRSGEITPLFQAISGFGSRPVGAVSALSVTTSHTETIEDAWGIDVSAVMINHGVHGSSQLHSAVLASLAREQATIPAPLEDVFGVPVSMANSETDAASLGAGTTPGLSPEALILDIGGGTIDLIGNTSISAAGAGQLLSAAVASVLRVPRGAADWIKRGPSWRVESPRILLGEDGSRDFSASNGASAVPPKALGALVTPGPGGWLIFGEQLQPAEWRIARQALKMATVAENVNRVLRTYSESTSLRGPFDIVVVGGPVADDELLPALGRLSLVRGLGKGNVAAKLGHRYAVAYGLTMVR